jgi:DNA-binding response OmpR family regulator
MADAALVRRPDLKVLFITGYAENAAISNGHLEPGMHVMSKPFPMDILAARIRSMIEGGLVRTSHTRGDVSPADPQGPRPGTGDIRRKE